MTDSDHSGFANFMVEVDRSWTVRRFPVHASTGIEKGHRRSQVYRRSHYAGAARSPKYWRSPLPHALIESIDTSKAESVVWRHRDSKPVDDLKGH